MSAKKIYWRNRRGESPPQNAQFFWRPFCGKLEALGSNVISELPSPLVRTGATPLFSPEKKEWKKSVETILSAIRKNQVEKVVLARQCQVVLPYPVDPFQVLAALKDKAQGATLFCVEMGERSFLGASPEMLFVRNKNQITTEALAGTQPKELSKELFLRSEKHLREIVPVQKFLREALKNLIQTPLLFSPFSIHETASVQHLYSSASGTLKTEVSDHDLIEALHPTPALAGAPRAEATELIAELEPFSRGLYGGVLGWMTPERSEWIVAIRSCLLEGAKATLFSGTGIVEGSDPEEEWQELDHKLKLYEGIFL